MLHEDQAEGVYLKVCIRDCQQAHVDGPGVWASREDVSQDGFSPELSA